MKKLYSILITYILFFLFFLTQPLELLSQWEKIKDIPFPYANNYWLEIWFLKPEQKLGWICGRQGMVIRTTDQGATWQGSSVGDDIQLESVCFPTAKIGYTSGIWESGFEAGKGEIYKSTDGGATWTKITPDGGSQLWGCYFTSADTGMVVGGGCGIGDQFFYRTTNGGKTWTSFKEQTPGTGMTDVILFSSKGLGYAVSSGYIWITHNGGQSWTILSNSGGLDWQEDLSISGNSFLVPYSEGCGGGGGGGGIRMSTDNTSTWTEFSTGQSMFGTFLLDSERGWAVGLNKSVYYTSDGGQTWTLENCGIENDDSIDDPWFINDTTGFIAGDGVYRYMPFNIIPPVIAAKGKTEYCDGDSVVLTVANKEYKYYLWSNGERTRSIAVKTSGVYSVTTWNNVCDSSISGEISVNVLPSPKPVIKLTGNSKFCEGDSAILSVIGAYPHFVWSTGDTSASIVVRTTGKYTFTAIDTNGCAGSSSINLEMVPNPTPVITVIDKPNPCVGDSVRLEVDSGFSSYEWFRDSLSQPVSKGSRIYYVKESGTYYAVVKNDMGCVGSAKPVDVIIRLDTNKLEITYELDKQPFPTDSVHYPEIKCAGISIKNVGWKPFEITDAKLAKNIAFSIPYSQLPISILPGESKDLMICYSPTAIGLQNDTLTLGDVCTPHRIEVIGIGAKDYYTTNTQCNVPIKMVTIGIAGRRVFSLYNPRPNPGSIKVSLPYTLIFDDPGQISESCIVFNTYGNEEAIGIRIPDTITKKNGFTTETGSLEIDVSGLSQGIYFIVVTSGVEKRTFPISIVR